MERLFEHLDYHIGHLSLAFWFKLAGFSLLLLLLAFLFPVYAQLALSWLLLAVINTFPIWLPFLLALAFWRAWLSYRRAEFLSTQEYILLEIRLPQIIDRSPAAMELAILGLFQTAGQTTWYDRQILGKTRPWFSLELVSIEGTVHFYIWMRKIYKDVVEAAIYGQYPTVEIFEVEDYTKQFPYFDHRRVSLYGMQYKYRRDTALPIKTYIDYGLDQNPKEEFKVDPLSPILEYLSNLGPGEQMWLQILIRAYKEPQIEHGGTLKLIDFYESGRKVLKKLREEQLKEKSTALSEEERTYQRIPARGEAERFNAIDRKLSKQPFECAFRGAYLGRPELYQGFRASQLVRIWTPFNFPALNEISFQWQTGFDLPWYDFMEIRANGRRRKFMEAYRLRAAFFHPKNDIVTQFASAEEIASLFHFPGQVAAAPGLERIASRKAPPPPDLPR